MRLINVASPEEALFRVRRATIAGESSPAQYIDDDGRVWGVYVPMQCDRYHVAPDNTIGGVSLSYMFDPEQLDYFLPWLEQCRSERRDLDIFDYWVISDLELSQHKVDLYYHDETPGAVTIIVQKAAVLSLSHVAVREES